MEKVESLLQMAYFYFSCSKNKKNDYSKNTSL